MSRLAAALLLALRLRVGRRRKPLGRGGFSRLATITKNRLTLLTASAESLTYLGVGAVESFLPLYALSLGLEPWEIGMLLTLQLVVITLSKPGMGEASDRYGRKPFIALGLATAAMSVAAIPLAHDFPSLLLLMAVNGVGVSATTSSTAPLISDLTPPAALGSAMGALETIKDVGHAFGPILTGWLITWRGYAGAFAAVALLIFLDSLLFTVAVRGARPPASRERTP